VTSVVAALTFCVGPRSIKVVQGIVSFGYFLAFSVLVVAVACDGTNYSSTSSAVDPSSIQDAQFDDGKSTVGDATTDAGVSAEVAQRDSAGGKCDTGWVKGRAALAYTEVTKRAWLNPDFARGADGLYASVINLTAGVESGLLVVSDFGLNVPASAKVSGIEAEITRNSDLGSRLKDLSVRLYSNELSKGDRKNLQLTWQESFNTVAYGDSNDLWDAVLSADDVNRTTFGLAIAVKFDSQTSGIETANVDQIRIRVSWVCP
jgi:hypothetical protein